ncbi:MAG: SDR family oxidoreductase [Armatimonadetes bacterium]|nr:SDR family oxidoreductase [Armatimonadota bacterium]MDW8122632.1 SDR family oxidoreductase [Armatimonadota bacterium]
MDLKIAGKVAIVTGGTKGIGRACVEALAREGCLVAFCARSDVAVAETARRLTEQTGQKVLGVVCDVTDDDQVAAFVEKVLHEFGTVHILVNNAGRAQPGGLDDLGWKEWQDDLNIKVFAHLRCIKAVVPAMKKQRWGRIININSVLGKQPSKEVLSTSTWRAACLALTKAVANELAPFNITVNSVNVGIIITDQLERRRKLVAPEMTLEEFAEKVAKEAGEQLPLGRLGRPEEVAAAVCFLASEWAGYITGSSLTVDGGASRTI